jgi:hypothetical protein
MARTRKPSKKPMPPVAAAFFCEKILTEPDNVLSAIRIVDTISLPGAVLPESGTDLVLPLAMLVVFKSGDAQGERELQFRLENPSGKVFTGGTWKITLGDPPEAGHTFRSDLTTLKWDKEGLYWFEVLLDGVLATRIPLRVRIGQPESPSPAASTGEG